MSKDINAPLDMSRRDRFITLHEEAIEWLDDEDTAVTRGVKTSEPQVMDRT